MNEFCDLIVLLLNRQDIAEDIPTLWSAGVCHSTEILTHICMQLHAYVRDVTCPLALALRCELRLCHVPRQTTPSARPRRLQ